MRSHHNKLRMLTIDFHIEWYSLINEGASRGAFVHITSFRIMSSTWKCISYLKTGYRFPEREDHGIIMWTNHTAELTP